MQKITATTEANIRIIAQSMKYEYNRGVAMTMADQISTPYYEIPAPVSELLTAIYMFAGGAAVTDNLRREAAAYRTIRSNIPDEYNPYINGKNGYTCFLIGKINICLYYFSMNYQVRQYSIQLSGSNFSSGIFLFIFGEMQKRKKAVRKCGRSAQASA